MEAYHFRRDLTPRELLPAIGAGIGAGLVVAYLAQLLLRKADLPARPPTHPRG
jgi:NhaP-type Na+/H+ or K+/H+ antiporter